MTTSPIEPGSDPEIVPSGDPAPMPVSPGEDPGGIPDTEPQPAP